MAAREEKMRPRCMITGATGMLGRALVAAFKPSWEVVATGFSRAAPPVHRLDLNNAEEVRKFVSEHKPHAIVHAAAERRPDKCENSQDDAMKLNVEATRTLAAAATDCGAWMLYISSDYVYDGTNPPYKPDPTWQNCHPLNFYGRTKLEGEKAALGVNPSFGVLRVPILHSLSVESLDESPSLSVAKAVFDRSPKKIDDWAIRCPTAVEDVAHVCERLCTLKMSNSKMVGGPIWQFGSSSRLTKYAMTRIIARLFELPHDHLEPDSSPSTGAPRPKDCFMDYSDIEAMGIARFIPLEEAFKKALTPFAPTSKH